MIKTTIQSVVRDAGKVTVQAQIQFDEAEFTAAEAEQFVKSAISDMQSRQNTAAALQMTSEEKAVTAQLGVSPRQFARFNHT